MLITAKADIRPPTAPVLGTPTGATASALSVPLTTPATDLVGVASYQLERATSAGGPFTQISAAASFPYADSGLAAATTYYYRATATDASGNVGTYSAIVSAATLSIDTTPDVFSFVDQTGVALSSTITSAPITVAGINTPAAISVSGGTYDINASGAFTASPGTVSNGNTVRARHTSSASNSTATNTIVTIGGVSDTFTSTTAAGGGSVTAGSSNVTSGSGFGATGPTVLAFDHFETGTNGAAISTPVAGNAYEDNSMTYSTTRAHSGTKCAFGNWSSGSQFQHLTTRFAARKKWYSSSWVYIDATDAAIISGGGGGGACKILQIHNEAGVGQFSPGISYGTLSGIWHQIFYQTSETDTSSENPQSLADFTAANGFLRAWFKMEMIVNQSDPNTANGSIQLKLNNTSVYNRTSIITRESTKWHDIHIWIDGGTNFATYPKGYGDELLVQHEWSRLELVQGAMVVPQLVTAWADNSITWTHYRGALANGAATVRVTNSAGTSTDVGTVTLG